MAKRYDAIVVGSGACGGWAAMELSTRGMQVLMLEAGAHIDPATEFKHTFLYQLDFRGLGAPGLLRRYDGTERNYRIFLDNGAVPQGWWRAHAGPGAHRTRGVPRRSGAEQAGVWAVGNDHARIGHTRIASTRIGPAGSGGATTAARPRPLSSMIHECGTARMSDDPREGVLNPYCQTHHIPNLYVFGGNAFPSTGDKHPTLTMMALTARGCDRVIDQANRKVK